MCNGFSKKKKKMMRFNSIHCDNCLRSLSGRPDEFIETLQEVSALHETILFGCNSLGDAANSNARYLLFYKLIPTKLSNPMGKKNEYI